MKGRDFLAGAALALLAPTAAGGYEVYPFRPIHEVLTRLSYQCLQANKGAFPEHCANAARELPRAARWRPLRNFLEQEKAASWPDDPVREIAPPTIVPYTLRLKYTCARTPVDPVEPAFTLAERGLMCNSHFGALQFMHAMKSAPEENAEDTRRRILDWAMFTYRVATGRLPAGESYCAYFRGGSSVAGEWRPSSIASDFAPPGFAGCEERLRSGAQPPLTVGALFTTRCGNPFDGRRCRTGPYDVKTAARGALLHLIQDSFSQSHAKRGPGRADGKFDAVVECLLPSDFFYYDKGTAKTHGAADVPPVLGRSCAPGAAVDDVVTAGAKVIWHVERNSDPGEVRAYLETKVFGVPAVRHSSSR